MLGLSLLRKLSPRVFLWLLYPATLAHLLVKLLTGTVYGAFLVSVMLYFLMREISESRPYTFDQMLLWVDALDTSAKTAIATSVITILGFLVAFHTATINWKQQAITNLKLNAASGIQLFYNEFLNLVTEIELEAEYVLEAFEAAKKEGINQRTALGIQMALNKIESFLKNRQRLSEMSVEVHELLGRDYSLLGTVWGVVDALQDCANAVKEITIAMWIRVPSPQVNMPDFYEQFLSEVSPDEWRSLIECCDRNHRFISATIGGVRGSLLSPEASSKT